MTDSLDARPFIDTLLARALNANASDIHIEPTSQGADVRLRIDGLLQTTDAIPRDLAQAAVLRLMVLAQLLTYRLDIPQEGRIPYTTNQADGLQSVGQLDLRLAIIPTARGLRAVVRLPAHLHQPRTLEDLQLPPNSMHALQQFALTDAGMLLVTGPAGSGKTTTIYAILEHIARTAPGLSIISLEDPVERLLPGVTQIEVAPHGQLTYQTALKSILRQDPQVLMLGEIRDPATATIALQAALSGHRLIATLHAADPATTITRLLDMGLEPYQLTSSLFGILSQRLLRKLAPSGYSGRLPIAEFASLTPPVKAAILARRDADSLRSLFGQQPNYLTLRQSASALLAQHLIDEQEILRTLGPT